MCVKKHLSEERSLCKGLSIGQVYSLKKSVRWFLRSWWGAYALVSYWEWSVDVGKRRSERMKMSTLTIGRRCSLGGRVTVPFPDICGPFPVRDESIISNSRFVAYSSICEALGATVMLSPTKYKGEWTSSCSYIFLANCVGRLVGEEREASSEGQNEKCDKQTRGLKVMICATSARWEGKGREGIKTARSLLNASC